MPIMFISALSEILNYETFHKLSKLDILRNYGFNISPYKTKNKNETCFVSLLLDLTYCWYTCSMR